MACRFCRTRFFSDSELFIHMQSAHEQCFLCRRAHPDRYIYYKDYNELEGNVYHPCCSYTGSRTACSPCNFLCESSRLSWSQYLFCSTVTWPIAHEGSLLGWCHNSVGMHGLAQRATLWLETESKDRTGHVMSLFTTNSEAPASADNPFSGHSDASSAARIVT